MQTNNNNKSIIGGLSAAFYTLGCRVNQYETQAMEEQFRKHGFEIKSFDDECDIYVINTCTVTAESDRKSRQIIRRTAQVKKPSSIVIVCGCYSQGNPNAIAEIGDVDIIIGNTRKTEIVKIAQEFLKTKQPKNYVENINSVMQYEEASISSSDRTRAFVKIVDGCENHCTYCIIPSVRGKIRSRHKEDILNEVKQLALSGYKEIVLTGIETAAYGKDFDRTADSPLVDLIEECAKIPGIMRIRLGSMEPTVFNDKFVKRISKIPELMPHFHLSLQSGSDNVLKNMKRKYNTNMFFEVLERLRANIPDVQITTDIIAGFPGESENDFIDTLNFVKKCKFSFVHIFPYSKRDGTPAAKMQNQINKSTKKMRVLTLENEMKNIREEILHSYIGTTTYVLLETENNGVYDGYSPCYIKVKIPIDNNSSLSPGDIVPVIITKIDKDDDEICLMGEQI